MTSQGPVAPPPLPLLVKDKNYTVDIAHTIIQDVDLDKCSEHETNPLGDSDFNDMVKVCVSIPFVPLCRFVSLYGLIPLFCSSLFDIDSSLLNQGLVRMQALQIYCSSREALIQRLKDHLESEVHNLKKFKDSSWALG